jgi:hypothetical protein
VRQAERDDGQRPGLTTDETPTPEAARTRELRIEAGERDPSQGVGVFRALEAVEFAILEWVDWFNHRRLLEPIGDVPRPNTKGATMSRRRRPNSHNPLSDDPGTVQCVSVLLSLVSTPTVYYVMRGGLARVRGGEAA